MLPRQLCLIAGCTRFEELANGRPAGGLCATHRKRKGKLERGQRRGRAPLPLQAPVVERFWQRRDARQALREAALAYADANTDAEYDSADERLLHAAMSCCAASDHGAMHQHAPEGRKVPSKSRR